MNFLWGAATSSHQVEGGNLHNDWAKWEQAGKIETGEVSGKAADHWNRYQEDLELASELGLNAYRFSIEWSRLEPKPGHWDLTSLEWYAELIGECERRGLMPLMTLHHFTSPEWFARHGGFTAPEAPHFFHSFVTKVVQTLGARVPIWCTFNEPMVMVIGQYLGLFMPPAQFHPESASRALHGLLSSHVKAYDTIHGKMPRRKGPFRHYPLQVGIAHNMMDFRAARHWHPMERLLASAAWKFYNQSWLEAITGKKQSFAVTGLVPLAPTVPGALGRRTADFIGVNYYTKALLRWRPKSDEYERSTLLPFGVSFSEPGEPKSDLGWALAPEGLGRILRFVKSYGLPIYITENGIADDKDSLRSRFLLAHLDEIAHHSEVRGYFHWSLMDNFEWIKGFGPRFGLIEVDYQSFERKVRESARLYRAIIEAHGHRGAPNLGILQKLKKSYGF